MKLIRCGEPGQEYPGVELEDGTQIDVSDFGSDFDEDFFGTDGIQKLKSWLKNNKSQNKLVPAGTRLGPPVKRPSKIICIGLNYAKHAEESGATVPEEPVIFFKATSAIVGPNDDLIIPKNSTKTDWEVELGIVIGKKASYVSKEEAMDHVAGYVLHNDYSEREFQLERAGQWVKGKSCDTFAPIGPYVVTKDEVKDPHNLKLWLKLNGEIKQQSNTSDMVFDVPTVVSYLSQFMSLMPGDIISTGTPFGVGMGLKPQRYVKPGDVIELGIDGLGSSKQVARAWQES
ncbi:fumarylacetoacetate hydrolase family protein [Gramella jeungdoensis]|uniref:Fumarylacetoacetate hydrolase family protein n=1 Tax=Gramella jeungdoensis TaxID=708091 RepID=A0ABT0YY96_9FLAO|nr:fumarylacetoacetate hydrolase family protein [Gramella jeungdoensis]MCM8568448.1 fumarylacetoacetate hydrolase family protein [Gramella jeungdoensis]